MKKTGDYAPYGNPISEYAEPLGETELVSLGNRIVRQFEEARIYYLPTQEYLDASISHYCNPRSILVCEDDFAYLQEYVADYFND